MPPFTVYWMRTNVEEAVFIQFLTMVSSLHIDNINITDSTFSFVDPLADGEPFLVLRFGNEIYNFCTTYGNPYTKDVMKCLVIMVELGMTSYLIADTNTILLEALDEVEAIFNLTTYSEQKKLYSKDIV